MPYSIRADLEAQYGSANVSTWADLNSNKNGTEIAARVAWAIAKADAYLDDRLRFGPYAVPFAGPPLRVRDMSATLAGTYLYDSRGVTDYDADGKAQDQLQWQRKSVDRDIRDILTRRLRLDLEETSAPVPRVIDGTC